MKQIQISGKVLGEVALPGFCPRCFWIKLRSKNLPYQIFPGIFASIDAYTKKVVHQYFEKHNSLPACFANFGVVGQPAKIPHHNRFKITDRDTNIVLTGTPDEILRKSDGSYSVIDYKTARFTRNQDELLPMYIVQLNAYAYIAERTFFKPVTQLGLLYCEPVTEVNAGTVDVCTGDKGFSMDFVAKLLDIECAPDSIRSYLRRVREIHDLPQPPEGTVDCKNCRLLNNLLSLL
jgi:hypothetical protein